MKSDPLPDVTSVLYLWKREIRIRYIHHNNQPNRVATSNEGRSAIPRF